MARTHLDTAHEYGTQKALEAHGYASINDLQKEAAELGLLETPAQPQKKVAAAPSPLDDLFQKLDAKLR